MLSDIRYWEKKATEGHYAIPHFNVWNAEMLMGVIDAAEELRAPIIISFGTGFTGNTSFEDFCYMMDSMAKKATVPVIALMPEYGIDAIFILYQQLCGIYIICSDNNFQFSILHFQLKKESPEHGKCHIRENFLFIHIFTLYKL